MPLTDRVTRSVEAWVSASTKMSISPEATFAPVWQAHCLPNQSGGSSGLSTTVRRASSVASARAIDAVSSVEWSLTKTTSSCGYDDARIDRRHAPILRDSLRAGTITVTCGAPAGGSADSSPRNLDCAMRMDATIGVTIQG